MDEIRKKDLESQGYRLVGNHSAVKVCHWCKSSIKGNGSCYKNAFYGIRSEQCVQMTPAVNVCNFKCAWCWRNIDMYDVAWSGPVDEPDEIIDGCITAQVDALQGFGGSSAADKVKFAAAQCPIHFAISLAGEPTLYPKLPELIDRLKARGITAFLVTNGSNPQMIRKLLDHQPTQLYLTFPAPDEESFIRACRPGTKNAWQNILETAHMLEQFDRSVLRLTLTQNVNMHNPDKYAFWLKQFNPSFYEFKSYMWVGHSRKRNPVEAMSRHEDILAFARRVAEVAGLKLISEKPDSRVVLLVKEDRADRIMEFASEGEMI